MLSNDAHRGVNKFFFETLINDAKHSFVINAIDTFAKVRHFDLFK